MTASARTPVRLCVALLAMTTMACAPRLRPLEGAPAPARFPRAELPPDRRRLVFRWELEDPEMSGRGEGAARVAPPDSARLDFFLAGGMGGGAAILAGHDLVVPGGDMVRKLIPPTPLLWAALGRLAVPALPDTVARVDGTVLRADIGRPVAWRITFRQDSLVRVERVSNGRIVEWVERSGSESRYRDESRRRALRLVITRVDRNAEFDASIWRLP